MEMNSQELLSKILLSFPFAISAVVLILIGYKRIERFFYMDYQENSKERFKDNFFGNVFMAFGIACLIPAYFAFLEGKFDWGVLPISFCMGALIVPISILGSYWQSYSSNKLWGGFMPIVREKYGYAQPQSTKLKVDLSKIKIPRRTIISAALVGFIVFLGINVYVSIIGWQGSVLSEVIFRLFISGLAGFGAFITITGAALSRRIQQVRDGEMPDGEDDN